MTDRSESEIIASNTIILSWIAFALDLDRDVTTWASLNLKMHQLGFCFG